MEWFIIKFTLYFIARNPLIVICEICQISRNRRNHFPKYHKLQGTVWSTVITKIFKFPSYLDSFCQINYFHELCCGHSSHSFQTKWLYLFKPLKKPWLYLNLFHIKYYFHISWYYSICTIRKQRAWATILVITFWDFLMFYHIFLSSQLKRNVIISNKHGIYELPHEFPNDLRLRILGNQEILSRS